MDEARLNQLLANFPDISILVIGDFFLDKYLVIDRELSEMSLETGREAYQVVEVRTSPGAAGTVVSNLRALDVDVIALGIVGDDGNGYELLRGLAEREVNAESTLRLANRFTPTYTKPMLRESDGSQHELHRMDIKNREPLPPEVEQTLIARLRHLVSQVHGVVVADQVQEHNCGVITDNVRAELASLARAHPEKVFIADSRERIGLFRNVMIKPNRREALKAADLATDEEVTLATIERCGKLLSRRDHRPVFITLGDQGILVCDADKSKLISAVPIEGPIDIVGAGDSAMGGIVSSLCAGAELREAALVGNLAASVTIQQIGTTGTASRQQVLERFREFANLGHT